MNPFNHPITLQDVARAAGKSAATVSRALRNHPAISAATRHRIQRIASQMGYHPHPMLSVLMTRLRHRHPAYQETIACLCSARGLGPVRAMIDEFLIGANDEARRLGYSIDVYWMDTPDFSAKAMLHAWRAHRVRGAFLWNVRPDAPLDLPWDEFAWVVSGGITHAPDFHRVSNEIFQIVKLAIKESLKRGYRRPGLAMSTSGGERVGFRWVGAFLANVMRYGISLDMDSVFQGELTRKNFIAWQERFQADVILSLDDMPKQWIQDMGQDVPSQTGFLHLAANLSEIGAAGVAQDFREGGRAIIRALDGELRRNDFGIPSTPLTITVPGSWKEGATVRPPPCAAVPRRRTAMESIGREPRRAGT